MKFLFTTFEGGGHVPPAILAASLLMAKGHEILFVSDQANRDAAQAAGLRFHPWTDAPNRRAGGRRDDPLADWREIWPPAVVKAVCDAVITGPAKAYATDTADLIRRFRPDVVVTNELLFGVLVACEAAGVSTAILTGNLWCFPNRPDVPPFGPGWRPARSEFEHRREASARRMIERWYDVGLSDLNAARAALGLTPSPCVLDQLATADAIVIGASGAFDFGDAAPSPFTHAGPLFDIASDGARSDLVDPNRRNVLVSFSTTFQSQSSLMARCLRALEPLDVNVVATTGPAVDPEALPSTRNARIVRYAPHDAIVPYCDLVICHGGHGTLLRPLLSGVPVLCLPMGRDHADNGRRVVERGAGAMLSRRAPAFLIRRATRRLLEDSAYSAAAFALGRQILTTMPAERRAGLEALEAAARRQTA